MRVVSLTPSSLDRDSRTLKQAASVARLGHESIVVEAVGSTHPPADQSFRRLTLRSVGESLAAGGGSGGERVESLAALAGRLAGPAYFLASWTAFNLLTARRLPPADLYWLHGYEQAGAVWLRRTPYVYDAHDLYAALPFDGRALTRNERATHRVRLAIERACARRATACVTTSAAMARACERHLGVPFEVLRNAQDLRVQRPATSDVRTAAGVAADSFLIVMVGHHKPGTVIPRALPAGVELVLVGDGYAGAPPAGVHFAGPVPPEQIGAYLATADAAALLYVPVNENSPAQLVNGLFHAVAAGLPLLYPRRMEAIAELCADHGLGVAVDPEDPASLAAGIAQLRADLEARRAAVRRAQPELGWEREEERLATVLDGALGH